MSKTKFNPEHFLHFTDIEFLNSIKDDQYGVGVKFKDDRDTEYITVADMCHHEDFKDYRLLRLNITSFRGAIGAMHYYGSVRSNISNYEPKEKCHVGGYIEKYRPAEAKDIDFDLHRMVTEEEINSDKDEDGEIPSWSRWYGYKEGALTNAFDTQEQVIEAAKSVVKHFFKGKGKWALEIDSYDGRQDDIIAVENL